MTISQVTHKIHRKKSHLWGIEQANKGNPIWVQAHKDAYRRNKKAKDLRQEIETLQYLRNKLKEEIPKALWYPKKKYCGRYTNDESKTITSIMGDAFKSGFNVKSIAAYFNINIYGVYRRLKGVKKMANSYFCSDGTKVTQAQINEKLRRHYSVFGRNVVCQGCGKASASHAHIIAQARCKQIRKTELIWDKDNWFYACLDCNRAIENPKGQEWKKLRNKDYCLRFIEKHDSELYQKFIVNL